MEPKTEIIRKIKEIEGMDWHTVDGKKVRCHITYVTSDYTFFKDFEFNREKGESHVVELQISLRKRNLMCVRPVVVNEKHPVLDGQHLLEACKRERFEVPYTILRKKPSNPRCRCVEILQNTYHLSPEQIRQTLALNRNSLKTLAEQLGASVRNH